MIPGMGPDQPTTTEANGAKQSDLPYRYDLIDPPANARLAAVMKYGADKYGADNWRRIDSRSHINHAIAHLYAHLDHDDSDDHLEHALTRVHMALAVHLAATTGAEPPDDLPEQKERRK